MRLLGLLATLLAGGVLISSSVAETPAPPPRAAVWRADVPGGAPELVELATGQVTAAGYATELLDSVALTNVTRLTTNSFALLVLPNARILPMESIAAIEGFLRQGGHLLALGLTAWETPTFRIGSNWMSRAGYDGVLARVTPERALIDFATEPVEKWVRHSNRSTRPARAARVTENGSAALRVAVEALDGWDTLEPPARAWDMPPGQTLTCFRAKGNAATRQLAVEWTEEDGSRWIATVDLTPQWQTYALPREAFRPWQPPANRSGAGERLNLRRAARFTVGLALTHTAVEPGALEYWFADFGTAANPLGDQAPPPLPVVPRLESLAPGYQAFTVTTPSIVRPPQWQAITRSATMTKREEPAIEPPGLRALHPRPRGVGWKQDRPWRWQPFLTARDADTGDYRGAVGVLLAHERAPFAGGIWMLCTPADVSFYSRPAVRSWLDQALQCTRQGALLMEGGAEYFTLFPEQAVRLGARVHNFRPDHALDAEVIIRVLPQLEDGEQLRHRQTIRVAPGGTAMVETTWAATNWPASGAVVAVQLLVAGEVVDELYHELNRWQPPRQPAFVAARDGGLWREGQVWKAHGVNYLPSSGLGVASEHFEYWLGRGAYDPEVIERDLRRVKGMGLNAVSAFVYHRDLGSQHLLDFLFRCERRGLQVNLSLRPGTPMEFRWPEMKALIEYYRLAQNDTVMAYDLAWEPSHYDHAYQQQHYGSPWTDWARRRYGSLAAAGKAWGTPAAGYPAPTDDSVPVPPMSQLVNDGPWRTRVADYRRFLDELVGERYAEARRLVRTLDPNHPVSFRMQHAGDPTHRAESLLPYDFFGLRDAVDIWEPEAYGRVGDWEQVQGGIFTATYARLCDPAKPVVWAEMGTSVWDVNTMADSPTKLAFAARFYRDFYRMLRASGADGVFFWWYPGGFRLFENSDYGILNPDGTDRSVTTVIREAGPQFMNAPKPGAPTRWLEVDRDRDARGLPGIHEAVQSEYWRAMSTGEGVGLKWRAEPGGAR